MRETVGKGRSGVRGSMTLFAALSIMLVASFLFVMLEAARQQQLRRMAQMHTSLVLESVFSNYCEPLWTKYQILALNNGRTEEQEAFAKWEYYAKELSDKNFGREGFMAGANHLRMSTEHTEFTAYRLLTDEEGKAYIKSIADYMRNTVARQTVETLIAQYQQLSGMDIREEPDDSALVGADDAIAAAKEAEAETTEDTVSPPAEETAIEVEENPLEIVKSLWNQGTLSLVLKNPKEVSKAKEDLSDAVSGRKRYEGCGMEPLQIDVVDEVLFTEYLLKHFACYTEGTAAGELAYELEYLLCGNEKDESNLSGTVQRLLAMREAANLVYLATDAAKQELAYSVALALAGFTANPAIIYAVKAGLLAAWAFVESILDVRALLSGDKIALVKNSTQWTSDLLHLGSAFSSFGKATDCKNGLSYQRYLGFLLMLKQKDTCYRAMDLQEQAIRAEEGTEDVRMDQLVVDAAIAVDYSYHTIFMGMEVITRRKARTLSIPVQKTFSYRKAGV